MYNVISSSPQKVGISNNLNIFMLSYCNKVMTTTIMMNLCYLNNGNKNLAIEENTTQLTYTMLRSIRVIEVITHNITFKRITFHILLP